MLNSMHCLYFNRHFPLQPPSSALIFLPFNFSRWPDMSLFHSILLFQQLRKIIPPCCRGPFGDAVLGLISTHSLDQPSIVGQTFPFLMRLGNLIPDDLLSLRKKSGVDKGSQWTAVLLLECLQEVTSAYDASAASIPKVPGLWNLLEVEDHAVSLNPSETQWYHLLPSLL